MKFPKRCPGPPGLPLPQARASGSRQWKRHSGTHHFKNPAETLPPLPPQSMISAAITALTERAGSSSQAIAKYLGANFKLPANFPK